MFENLTNQSFNSEQDFRLAIINSLLSTPHRVLEPYYPLFQRVLNDDPLFFGHLAAWYSTHGSIRDLNQLFSAFLISSKFGPEHREAGLSLLSSLPPYQVERIFRILKGGEVRETVEDKTVKQLKLKNGKLAAKKTTTKKFVKGIMKSVPRCFRTAVKDYLREREAEPAFFDSAVLHARKQLKSLYASLRIKPGDYAQAILFDNKPPRGSRLFALKQLAKSTDSIEQATIIIDNKIPYRVAASVVSNMSATTIAALVSAMTPQEVINNLASLKKRGALDNADIKKLVEAKLDKAKGDTRVSALKTRVALEASGVDNELAKKLTEVGDTRVKAKGSIKKDTLLAIDKSGSLAVAIEVGKQLAAVIAPVCQGRLVVMAFDKMNYEIKAKGTNLSDWEAAFKGINAAGGTACGAPVRALRISKTRVDQIIMVTDQGENEVPRLLPELEAYSKEMGVQPNIVFLNVGTHSNGLEAQIKKANWEVESINFTSGTDYYSLINVIPMLSGGGRIELLQEIMDTPLPTRKTKEPVTA